MNVELVAAGYGSGRGIQHDHVGVGSYVAGEVEHIHQGTGDCIGGTAADALAAGKTSSMKRVMEDWSVTVLST